MNKYSIVISIFLTSLFFISCEQSPTSTVSLPDIALEYQVSIPGMPLDSLHITCTINKLDNHEAITMLAPPMYADNPILEQAGINFHNVSITDPAQNIVSYTTDSLTYGPYSSLTISFSPVAFPMTIEYDVTFLYNEHEYMPPPHIDDNAGYLQGNYLFMIPCLSNNMVDNWRTPIDIYVKYNLGNNVNLYGDPASGVSLQTPYELLFSTSAILSSTAVSSQLLFEGEASGQAFRFVNISSTTTFTGALLDTVKRNFMTILNDITPKFGIINEAPFTVITGINEKIGLEGMYAFCLLNPKDGDTRGVLNMTMAHEMVHSWVGIRVGDYDDPWWKEGSAFYLGFLIPKRHNLCTGKYVMESLLDSLPTITAVEKYALSDPEIRPVIYTSPEGVGTFVYRKGGQVCMLLDRRIREVSKNATTFDTILAAFVKQFDGKFFRRNEYLAFLNEYSGGDVKDIFDRYVDQTGRIPYSVLLENFNALDSLGAFGD